MWTWQERVFALAAGCHPRLGSDSPIGCLSCDLIQHIALLARPPAVVSGSWDGTARLWYGETFACAKVFRGHTGAIRCVAADSTRIFTGSHDTTVRVWRASTGACERVLAGHRHWVLCFQLLPSLGYLASGSRDKTIRVWNLMTGTCLQCWEAHTWAVWSLALSEDQTMLFSGGGDHAIRAWDTASWREAMPPLIGHTAEVQCLRTGTGAARNILASCGGAGDFTAKIWDLSSGTCLRTLSGHEGIVWSAAIAASLPGAPPKLAIVTASDDGTVREWDATTGAATRKASPPGTVAHVFAVLVADGRDVDLASAWYREDDSLPTPMVVSFPAPSLPHLVKKQFDEQVRRTPEESHAEEDEHGIRAVRFMATASADKSITLWDYPRFRPIKQLIGHTEANLIQLPIRDVGDAHALFGEKSEQGYTPLVFVPRHRIPGSLRMRIPHGFDSIVVENGRVLGVFKTGLYYRSYFFQIAYLVNKQHIPYHFAVKSCPTRDNVRVDIHVDFLFHVADSMKFVFQIAPENMEELLRATQAESVRSLVRTVRVDQARDLRGMNSEDMLLTLNDKLNPYGIQIDQVTIASVQLPEDVAEHLQSTTAYESKQQLLQKQQMYDLKVLNDAQFVLTVEQSRANERARAEEVAKKQRQATEQQIEELEAKLQKQLEAAKASLNDRVAEIKAQCDLEIGRIDQEREKLVFQAQEEGKLEQLKVQLEAEKYVQRIRAETSAKIAGIRAEILSVRAKAEGYAGERLKRKREHELEMERLEMLKSLAENPNTFISGEVGENAIAQLVTATRAAAAMGIKMPSVTQVSVESDRPPPPVSRGKK